MPDHQTLLDNLWLFAGISLGGGGFAGLVASVFADLGCGLKLLVSLGVAIVIFGTIYFSAHA